MSAQIRTQYFGPEFMQATQIYGRHSVMRQDDTTNQQDDRPSGQDNMTNRQDNRTSRQGDIENRHRVIFDPYTAPQTSSIHAYDTRSCSKFNIICTSKNFILKKKSQLTFLQQIVALLFLQVQYINYNLSEIIIVHVVKAAIIVISEHFNLSTLLVVSHVLSTKMSPE